MCCLYLICIIHIICILNAKKDEDIQYTNIAFDVASGLSEFSRATGISLPANPGDSRPISAWLGPPEQISGIAVFDYDNDGDLDLFINQGAGFQPSLFQNQLSETSKLEFIDVAASAGFNNLKIIDQHGEGVCHGDINNDGCTDILTLGYGTPNLLFINNCDGTFTIAINNGIENNKNLRSTSCSFGDINNDGYIDVVIGNTGLLELADQLAAAAFTDDAYIYSHENELYLNNGDNTFIDISSNIVGHTKFSIGDLPETSNDGNNTLTWAYTMIDIDQDGYLDLIEINDQMGPIGDANGNLIPTARPRGVNQIFYNQHDNTFISKPFGFIGSFMGIAQGDLNCDGNIDLFVSNFGSYAREVLTSQFFPTSYELNYQTRWFFYNESFNGNFNPDSQNIFDITYNPDIAGNSNISPFGWGCAIFDYDNDGDYDILVHGGLDPGFFGTISDNPGIVYINKDGCFNNIEINDNEETNLFEINPNCVDNLGNQLPGCTYHSTRNVWAVAIGDLDNDGFHDIISTSNSVIDLNAIDINNNKLYPDFMIAKNDEILDKTAFKFRPYEVLSFPSNQPPQVEWLGFQPKPGDLFVEISSGNKNNFIKIIAKGSKNILPSINGNVNRDGIGAILNINKLTKAITGGESLGSSNSFEKIFGLGKKCKADLTIKWPKMDGGYNINKLNHIKKGESITIYEIPCDFNTRNADYDNYKICVQSVTNQLFLNGFISKKLRKQFQKSMLQK